MYICICNAVTDTAIRRAVENGVRTVAELKMATGCSGNCGCCEQAAREVLNESLKEQGSFLRIVPGLSAA